MRVALGALILAGGLFGAGAPLSAGDECCDQGKAKPWKPYNTGVRWNAALSQDPARWAHLATAALNRSEGLSLADRENLVTIQLKQAEKGGWKSGLAPAVETARKEGKLILFFQLVGDLDLEGC